MLHICLFLLAGSLKKVLPASCPALLSSVLLTRVRHILTSVISRATFRWLSTVSRIRSGVRSEVLNAADRDICSYPSNFVTGAVLEPPETVHLPQIWHRVFQCSSRREHPSEIF